MKNYGFWNMEPLIILVLGSTLPAFAETPPKQLFLQHCSSCHGGDGTGRNLGDIKPQDLTSCTFRTYADQKRIAGAISGGSAALQLKGPMPAFAKVLDPNQIKELASYVRSLSDDCQK